MTRLEEIEEQTRIRLAMLDNGYTPLANKDKQCLLFGWPDIVVDEKRIDDWSGSMKYRATGVRLQDGLVMIDLDIDDADMINDIIDALPADLWAVLETAPVRFGKGAKQAWFARVERAFPRWASAAYWKPGDSADDGSPMQRVEVFGGASARQAGVYGAHSIADDGTVAVQYKWMHGRGLLEVPLAELPVVTEAQIERLCNVATEVMARAGWGRASKVKAGRTEAAEVFGLTDDMEFVTEEGPMSLAELQDRVLGGPLRLSASWLEGDSAVNLTRCIAFARHDNKLGILETADFATHRPAEDEPGRLAKPGSSALDRLRAMQEQVAGGNSLFGKLGPAGGGVEGSVAGGEEGGLTDEDAEDLLQPVVDELLRTMCFCATDSRAPIYRIDGGLPMTLGNFKLATAEYAIRYKGPKGGVKVLHPADLWVRHEDRTVIEGAEFRPDLGEDRLAMGETGLLLNTYRAPAHDVVTDSAAAQALALWRAFLEHLVPDAGERAWLVNKLAAKAQRPWLPGVATLLVAEEMGTGRGTLFHIMEGLFGGRNCTTLNRTVLFGKDGQGQYTDWRAGHLIGFVHELLAGEDGGGFHHQRKTMYEHLKEVVEPSAVRFKVIEKFKGAREAWSFLSLFIATNHGNALPVERNDRRIAVLTCGGEKLDARADLQRLHEAKGDAGFLAAVWSDLLAVEVNWDHVMRVPYTAGRAAMITANRSTFDELIDGVLAEVPGDVVSMVALRQRVERKIRAEGHDGHKWQSRLEGYLSDKRNGSGWFYTRDEVNFTRAAGGGRLQRSFVYRGEAARAAFTALSASERLAAMRAEDPGKVVSPTEASARTLGLRLAEKPPEN